MRWLLATGLGLLALACPQVARAQAPVISPTMREPLRYVQVQIVSGRLKLTPRQVVKTRSSTNSSGNDRRERMSVDTMGQHPAIDYELATSQWQLVVQARNQTYFRVARELRGPGAAVPFEFRQSEEGDISFIWGEGSAQRQRRFSTLWHLLLVEPETAKTHLVPILEFFRPGANLTTSVDRITDALYANVDEQRAVPRQRWGQLVAQLTDSRYAQRESADRQLRAEGKAVLSFLEALQQEQLDFEQRRRIRSIRKSLTRGDDSDAPESIAAWLGSDPRVWLALLNQSDLVRRQVAAGQISRLLGETITFDSAAPLDTRRQQIEALRQQIEPSPAPAENKAG